MKRSIILCLLAISTLVSAQRFEGGVLLGMNVSQIHGDSQGGYRKAGLAAGTFVKTSFRESWGGLLELRYTGKGSSLITEDGNFVLRLQYIEIPILMTYTYFKKIQPQIGVSLGYLFRQTQKESGIITPIDEYNELEIAGCGGIDYEITSYLSVNIRYSISMIPIWQLYPGATSVRTMEAAYNDVITFAFYYQIGK
jgi:hypothetical protein